MPWKWMLVFISPSLMTVSSSRSPGCMRRIGPVYLPSKQEVVRSCSPALIFCLVMWTVALQTPSTLRTVFDSSKAGRGSGSSPPNQDRPYMDGLSPRPISLVYGAFSGPGVWPEVCAGVWAAVASASAMMAAVSMVVLSGP